MKSMNKTIYYHNQILLFTHKIMIPRKHAYISYQIRYLGTLNLYYSLEMNRLVECFSQFWKNRIILIFSVSYRPKTNAIENYFSQLKHYFGYEIDKFDFENLKKSLIIDKTKYNDYFLNYCSSRVDKKRNYQLISDIIKNKYM